MMMTSHHYLGLQILLLMISLIVTTQARSVKYRPSSNVVVGFVYCDTKTSHIISGVTVFVECNGGAFKTVTKTNKRGEFKLRLGSSTAIKGCQVSLVKSKDPYCATSSIRHVIKQQGSSHVSTFKPHKLQAGTSHSNGLGTQKSLLEPITNGPLLGPILQPILPQLPPLLGLPNPLQPPSPPSFGFPGGGPGIPGLTPSPPTFPIPFPPRMPNSVGNDSP
ncbi:hypothetical protein V2J09_012657 [Rumex salicifolius]